MVSSAIKSKITPMMNLLVSPFEGLGISPNTLTYFSFFLALVAAFVFLNYSRIAGVLLFLVSVSLDSLDGALARKIKKVTKWGGYLDAVVDKLVEVMLFFCMGVYSWPLAFAAGIASILVSYTKHRADIYRVSISGGILERAERMLLLLAGVLVAESFGLQVYVPFLLGLTFILSLITIIQRISQAKKLLE